MSNWVAGTLPDKFNDATPPAVAFSVTGIYPASISFPRPAIAVSV